MAIHYGRSKEDMRDQVSQVSHNTMSLYFMIVSVSVSRFIFDTNFYLQWDYDYVTSTYLLLLGKKGKNRPIRLVQQNVLTDKQRVT